MDLLNSPEDDLIQKHRKERKDLQAKIQNLKKTSDKKKKKETAELIARLEADLKEQQQSELDNITDSVQNLTCDDEGEESVTIPTSDRLSKAQRRRNKKSQLERENQRRINEQEVVNETGPRTLELKSIKQLIKARGLALHAVPSNGDCLYQAVSHQLALTNRAAATVQELRTRTATYMLANKSDVMPFMVGDDGDMMTEAGFAAYCDTVASTKAWGGQIELKAMAEVLQCPIHVLQAVGPATVLGEHFAGAPLVLTYHRHMYGLGEHYNSTQVASHDTDDNCTENNDV